MTVGQSQAGRFGITGTDDAFRDLPSAITDGCGQLGKDRMAAIGARVFDAPHYSDVRTVVYGLGGSDLRRAEVEQRGVWSTIPVSRGAFVLAARGYPEDAGLQLRVTFAGGQRRVRPLGIAYNTVSDPTGPAWHMDAGTTSGSNTLCAGLNLLRPSTSTPRPPSVCGALKSPRSAYIREPYVLSIATFHPGDSGGPSNHILPGGHWTWHHAPARTLAYGLVDLRRIKAVTVTANGQPFRANLQPGGGFAAILPGDIRASAVRVTFVPKHGTPTTFTHSINITASRLKAGAHR